jgi:hypothetical protein
MIAAPPRPRPMPAPPRPRPRRPQPPSLLSWAVLGLLLTLLGILAALRVTEGLQSLPPVPAAGGRQ